MESVDIERAVADAQGERLAAYERVRKAREAVLAAQQEAAARDFASRQVVERVGVHLYPMERLALVRSADPLEEHLDGARLTHVAKPAPSGDGYLIPAGCVADLQVYLGCRNILLTIDSSEDVDAVLLNADEAAVLPAYDGGQPFEAS